MGETFLQEMFKTVDAQIGGKMVRAPQRIRGVSGAQYRAAGALQGSACERDAPSAFACEARSSRTGPGLIRSLRYWNNAQVYRFARGRLPSLIIAGVIVAIIIIPKKKTSSPNVKEKRKAGTRAGLTKPAIAAAAAKLIESAGANGFSLRRSRGWPEGRAAGLA